METHTYALTITYVCVAFYIRMYIKHIGIFFTSPFFLLKKKPDGVIEIVAEALPGKFLAVV